MKFLIDNALSPRLASALESVGHDVAHVRDRGQLRASDPELLQLAVAEDRVLVSEDTDFGTLLALGEFTRPSIILFRRMPDRSATALQKVLLGNLVSIQPELERGAAVVIEPQRIRVRRLPIGSDG